MVEIPTVNLGFQLCEDSQAEIAIESWMTET